MKRFLSPAVAFVSLGETTLICKYNSRLHTAYLSAALVPDAPTHSLKVATPFDMVAERRQASSRVEALESLRKSAAAVAPVAEELSTGMVTAADTVTFQQQLRRELADAVQKLRTEMNETVNGRIDMLHSIRRTCQQNPSASNPYRISDFIP